MNQPEREWDANDVAFELGDLITQARLFSGMTQEQLAEKMGTKQPSISRVESMQVEPSISFLIKVAEAAGTKLVLPQFAFQKEKDFATCEAQVRGEVVKELEGKLVANIVDGTLPSNEQMKTVRIIRKVLEEARVTNEPK